MNSADLREEEIVIDFDIKDAGIQLPYIYSGDPIKLSRIYDKNTNRQEAVEY